MREQRTLAEEELLIYLRDPEYIPTSRLRAVAAPVVPKALRPRARVFATDLIRPVERRRARRLARQTPLQLHLGSSRTALPGWVNVDLLGDSADLRWNLLRPLPFPDASADAVFHEHVLEHFDFSSALRFCQECHRVLKPSGTLRISVPDAGEYFRRYKHGELAPPHQPDVPRPTPLLATQELFFRFGHRSAYDYVTLRLILHAAGFKTVRASTFRAGIVGPMTDSERRREGSLYCEATK